MNINIPFILDTMTKNAMREDNTNLGKEEEEKAIAVCNDIVDVFEKHGILPIEAYTITGALSDAIYLYLMNLSKK